MEKLKDILYDISDILLAIFIVAIMTTVISWKFAGSMAGNTDVPVSPDWQASQSQTNEEHSIAENTPEELQPSDTLPQEPTIEILEPEPEPEPEPEVEPEPEEPVSVINVSIPSGSTGVKIAGILKGKELVENTGDFISRIEARGLSSKLQSGSYNIKSDSTIDEIINILTNQ